MRRLVMGVLLLGAHIAAADPRSAAVRVYTFPQGTTALLAPDSLAGSVHVGVWYPAGSRNDPRGSAGLAYVLERAALGLPATTRRPLESAGAAFDRTVTPDLSSNSVTLPAEQLRAALEAMTANVVAPRLTDAALREGVAGARSERERRLAQSPLLAGIERVCATLFAGHGYAQPSSGLDAPLAAITLATAQADLASRFAPANALVTITGRFDTDEALAVLQEHFGAFTLARSSPPLAPAEFGVVVPRGEAGETPLPMPVVLAGWRLPPDRDPDSVPLEVLARLLTGVANPRVQQALLTEDSPFLQIQGSFERRRDACVLVVAAALKGKIDTVQVESKLAHEVERWASEPLTAADLAPAQHAVEADLLLRAQAPGGRAEAIANAQLADGDWRAWDARIAQVRALTPADVRRAAARALVAAHRTMVWTAPAPQEQEGQP